MPRYVGQILAPTVGTVTAVHHWGNGAFRFDMVDGSAQEYVVVGYTGAYGDLPPSVSSDVEIEGFYEVNSKNGVYHVSATSILDVP